MKTYHPLCQNCGPFFIEIVMKMTKFVTKSEIYLRNSNIILGPIKHNFVCHSADGVFPNLFMSNHEVI